MVCSKKGMVSTVSNAPGLISDKGYKKSMVNLEIVISAENRSTGLLESRGDWKMRKQSCPV